MSWGDRVGSIQSPKQLGYIGQSIGKRELYGKHFESADEFPQVLSWVLISVWYEKLTTPGLEKNLPNKNWGNSPQAHIETGIIHSTTRQNSKILEITMDQVGYSKDTVSVLRQN